MRSAMSGITRGQSCSLCQRRKVRCDQLKPCTNCLKANTECIVPAPRPRAKRGRTKLQGKELMERLKKYEDFMAQHGLDFESMLGEEDEVKSLHHDTPDTKESSDGATQNEDSSKKDNEGNPKWSAYYKEYRTTEAMLHGSSDEESDRPTIHQAFDKLFSEAIGFPFSATGLTINITGSHPSAIQIIQLWQIYIDNVNPLLGISHIPSLQSQIIDAGANPSEVPKEFETLMFGIYLVSIESLDDDEVLRTFRESKSVLVARYREATEQSLINVGFMRSDDLKILQGYLLYLLAISRYVDPRSIFCLIGIAVRIATRLGLHRDGARFGFSSLEVELRRRLWWQIVALDKRFAEMTGSAITALSSSDADCRLPLNVNDMDLHATAKAPPSPCVGATEMTFCLTRIEATIAASPSSVRPNPTIINRPESKYGPSTSPHTCLNTIASSPPLNLDKYTAYMESTYLKACDPKIPVQSFTLLMTRISLCKLRVFSFICQNRSSRVDPPQAESDAAFLSAIQMLEYDSTVFSTESLRRFLWYAKMQMPIPGYIVLANELCRRAAVDDCERAWTAIFENHDRRKLAWNIHSPMHMALGLMLLKAWAARVETELQRGRTLHTPRLITLLRDHIPPKSSQQGSASNSDPTSSGNGAVVSLDGPVTEITGQTTGLYSENPMMGPIKDIDDMYTSATTDHDELDWTNLMHVGNLWGGFDGSFDA